MTTPNFPRGLSAQESDGQLATARWTTNDEIETRIKREASGDLPDWENRLSYKPGRLWLGRTCSNDPLPVGYMDDRHRVTVAGTRAGKGVSAIMPALHDYPGSVICIDPKGENAHLTADRRGNGRKTSGGFVTGLRQEIYVLDPYDISGVDEDHKATFNPLSRITLDAPNAIEEAGLIAEALVIDAGSDHAHWDESAKTLIEALILHLISAPHFQAAERTLGKVRELIRNGDTQRAEQERKKVSDNPTISEEVRDQRLRAITPMRALLMDMEYPPCIKDYPAIGGIISGAAIALKDMGDRERGSVLSNARRNLKFLDAPAMQACVSDGEDDRALELERLKQAPNGATIYIVLPIRLMDMHARRMRMILNLMVGRLEADKTAPPNNCPVLAILDEFPILGHLPVMERAIGYMAGFGLKLWAILQDIPQLKRHYPKTWESFLGNAGILQFFGNMDQTTLDFISEYLGHTEVVIKSKSNSSAEGTSDSDISQYEKTERAAEGEGIFKGINKLGVDDNTISKSTSTTQTFSVSESVQKTPLMNPDEVRLNFSREKELQIIFVPDEHPIYLLRSFYYDDSYFEDKRLDQARPVLLDSA